MNPLEVNPQRDQENPGKGHVKAQRPDWLGCACCPPNLLDGRFAAALGLHDQEKLYVNLFVASRLEEPDQFTFEQTGGFPLQRTSRFAIKAFQRRSSSTNLTD